MLRKFFLFFLLSLFTLAHALDVNTYIPINAKKYLPVVQEEQKKYFPELQYQEYVPALIELESCITLVHSRCWSPNSKLQSARELGIGLGQITKAFKPDGSIRFDALQDMKNLHSEELKDASWSTIQYRVDVQARILILMTKDNYKRLFQVTDPYERLAMTDAAYNGGIGGLLKERRYCGMVGNCDPQKWFGNIENYCLKSKKPLYGKRSACDINRDHTRGVFKNRMPKYKQFYQ